MSAYSFEIRNAMGEELKELQAAMKTLLETRAGSQPADREFGISWGCLDEMPEMAETLFAVELYEKVEKYEPRLEVQELTFTKKGRVLKPKIVLSRKEDA